MQRSSTYLRNTAKPLGLQRLDNRLVVVIRSMRKAGISRPNLLTISFQQLAEFLLV